MLKKRTNSVIPQFEAIQTLQYHTVLMVKMPLTGKNYSARALYKQEQKIMWNYNELQQMKIKRVLCVYTVFSQKKAPNGESVAPLPLCLVTCCLQYEIGFDMTKWITQAVCNEIHILSSLSFGF